MKYVMLVAILALGGCGNLNWEKEAWADYYGRPAAHTERSLVERKVVLHWTTDPRLKQQVAILEKYNVLFEGSRIRRDYYVILNGTGTEQLGHVNEEGVFYRFSGDGDMVKVGEYPIIDTGVKVFFNFPLTDKVAFENIDPYRE